MRIPLIKTRDKAENLLYFAIWLVLFAAPVLSMYVQRLSTHGERGEWSEVLAAWGLLAMFFATFAVHNFLLAPQLVYHGRKWRYFAGLAALFIGFETYECFARPHPRPHEGREPMEARRDLPDNIREDGGTADATALFAPDDRREDALQGKDGRGRVRHEPTPPMVFGGKDMVATIIMSLLWGLNIGVKYFFKSAKDRKRLERMEREGQRMQLEYLKYQINPHFFMNTLNNIHALVDIDPAQAQHTIEVLSHLMRYVLYESNRPLVKMGRDLAFLSDYIRLMRLRYAESVRIDARFPEGGAEGMVPPLLFVCFVENAFKHGVSYERDSFIETSVETRGGRVYFACRNSVGPQRKHAKGGVGLANTRKRLELTYGKDFNLDIQPGADEYRVRLDFPLLPCAEKNGKTEKTQLTL